MSRHWCFPRWTALGGVMAIVVVCALVPRSAAAGCGDWLEHRFGTPPLSVNDLPMAPVAPCHGPGCRQAPISELPAVPVTISVDQQERLCIPSAASLIGPLDCSALLVIDDGAMPQIIRDRIDRPPRG